MEGVEGGGVMQLATCLGCEQQEIKGSDGGRGSRKEHGVPNEIRGGEGGGDLCVGCTCISAS